MKAPCPDCGKINAWARVECTPRATVRGYRCGCGKTYTVDEPPHPPEFFQVSDTPASPV